MSKNPQHFGRVFDQGAPATPNPTGNEPGQHYGALFNHAKPVRRCRRRYCRCPLSHAAPAPAPNLSVNGRR